MNNSSIRCLCSFFTLVSILVMVPLLTTGKTHGEDKVRVNILGYTRLPDFIIRLDGRAALYIDGTEIKSRSFHLFCKEYYILADNGIEYDFTTIIIKSPGSVVFISPHGDQEYAGDFTISRVGRGIQIINTVGINDYFASVLGSEMGGFFSDETLKAQAIALRTYFFSRSKTYSKKPYDIHNADGVDMVYRGSEYATPRMYRIMRETADLILTHKDGPPALPLFHSTSGGVILKDEVLSSGFYDSPADPVLTLDTDHKGIPLSSISPYYNFECYFDSYALTDILGPHLDLSGITDISVRYFNNTGCADFIGFVDTRGETHWLKAYRFVSLVQKAGYHKLRSIQFTVTRENGLFYFTGTGFGHLCGMSQYSAESLARNGSDYRAILKKYYPHLKLVNEKGR